MKKIVLSALFVALAVAMGYLFLLIPNVEMISATVFIAGAVVGARWGLLVGFVSELIFSLFNPMGAAAPPLLVAQLFCFMIIGFFGGLIGLPKQVKLWRFSLVCGLAGFFLTLLYDVLTTLSFALFIAGDDLRKLLTIFTAGAVFNATHSLINTIIFTIIVPAILIGIQRYQTSHVHA
ncbi:ECF transporter S component [candidate division KSB1 bacterium]|nr:ECF transporter S component [candidate division KSB1 bacterium]RQV99870.1 MAG: ECF transporter S component [candidate division KSB1 bacterium]